MNPVVQLDRTGCAIASVAAMMGMSYPDMKSLARSLGVTPEDNALWTSTSSIKWKIQDGNPSWHWVVFVREDKGPVVLDSKKGLRTNIRRDCGRMRPQWYIPVDVERTVPEESGRDSGS